MRERSSGRECRGGTKADVLVSTRRGIPEAIGGTKSSRIVEPRTAAKTAPGTITGNPSRAIRGGLTIGVVRAILQPLPDVTVNVVESEIIGVEASNRNGPRAIFTFRAPTVRIVAVEVRLRCGDLIARVKLCRSPGSRRVLPLRLGRQSVDLTGPAAEPAYILLRIVPAHVDHGLPSMAPTFVFRPMRAASIGYTGVPLGERHLVLGDREWPRKFHAVLWFFKRLQRDLACRRPHHEASGRNHHHLRTVVAVPKGLAGLQRVGRRRIERRHERRGERNGYAKRFQRMRHQCLPKTPSFGGHNT